MNRFHVKQKNLYKKKIYFIKEQESTLRERFGTTVHIKQTKSKDKGKIEIEFFSKEDLESYFRIIRDPRPK